MDLAFLIGEGLFAAEEIRTERHGRKRRMRFFLRAGSFFGLLFLFSSLTVYAQSRSAEYELKAAFLFHFAQLADWPAGALQPENRPFVICTTGEGSIVVTLQRAVEGKQIHAHSALVRSLRETDRPTGCDALFVVGENSKWTAAFLASVGDSPILTVGESADFLHQGGMIAFCPQENKIGFNINLKAAQKGGIKISSRLLLLAKSVIGEARQG